MKYVTPEDGAQIEGPETPSKGPVEARWKVACINWDHATAPHAISYLLVPGAAGEEDDMKHIAYHPKWEMAMARVRRMVASLALAEARRTGARRALTEVERRMVTQPSCGASWPGPHAGCFVADSLAIVRSMLAETGADARETSR